MNFKDAVRKMHDDSGISYTVASRGMNRSARYISELLTKRGNPRLDTCANVANAFGFRLIVRGDELNFSIRPESSGIVYTDEVQAKDAVQRIANACPLPKSAISESLGMYNTYIDSLICRESILAIEAFVSIVEACGYELVLKGHKKLYYLSKKARFSASNRGQMKLQFESSDSNRYQNKASKQNNSASEETFITRNDAPAEASNDESWQQRSVVLQSLVDSLKKTMDSTGGSYLGERSSNRSTYDEVSNRQAESTDGKAQEARPLTSAFEEDGESLSRSRESKATTADVKGLRPDDQEGLNLQQSNNVRPMVQDVGTWQSISQERSMTREEDKLADYKKRLLDLSMRNNLLNYRDKKTGTVHVLTPDLMTTYKRIVLNERPMTLYESSPDDGDQPKVSKESVIVTERTRADLIRSLRRLDSVARSSIDEQGINILYLAFGMLHWIDETEKEHDAPLVLAPVRLTRASARSSFVLQHGDDDPVVNPTLAYYLEQTHGIVLPSFEKEDQLQRFLIALESLILDRSGWSVTTDVVLSTFQFQKLSMYHDLEARSAEILAHPIVRAIMGDGSALGGVAELDNPDHFKPTDTYQVVDADASQQAAILAAHAGESFVLQGPPGTGKSQTITNIISDCLGSGKKVLFVSEKKAALDVVHRRLIQSKLDDFCLVLHSNKAGKKEVLGQLNHTLSLYGTRPRMSPAASTRLNTMVGLRNKLNGYADAIYTPIEPLGRSPYEIIGAVSRDEWDGIPWISCQIDGIKYLTPQKEGQMVDAVRSYARELERLGEKPDQNPWNAFGITNLEYGESGEVLRSFSQVSKGARELMGIWRRLTAELEVDISPTYDALEASVELLDDLSDMPVVPLGVSKAPIDRSRVLIIDWGITHKSLVSSAQFAAEALDWLERLDPTLGLEVEPSRLLEKGYAKELADELNRRLQSTAHYAAWQKASAGDVDAAVSQLKDRVDSYERHKGTILADYHPELLDIDFIAMETRFKTEYQSFFKRVFGQHGDDIRMLTGLRRSSSQVDDEEATRILALLHDLSNEERSLDERSEDYKSMLGECYRGMRTDFEQISRKRDALKKAQECISLLEKQEAATVRAEEVRLRASKTFGYLYDPSNQDWTEEASKVVDSLESLVSKYKKRTSGVGLGGVVPLLAEDWFAATVVKLSDELKATLKRRRSTFKKTAERANGADLGRRSLDQLADAIDKATSAGSRSLERSSSYMKAKKDCIDLGLEGFINAIDSDKRALDPEFLEQFDRILSHTLYRIWLGSVALVERPALRDFSAQEHERRVTRFSDLDAEQLNIDQARVLTELFPKIPSSNVRSRGKDEISILLRELNKKTRIRPIRKLFADIPHAVLALKPCLMMSPLSVSTYLESATFQFDTVIFDEASQVRTEDALGVISRGKQVIIAGDSKQLPPTNFFAATIAEDDDEGDEEYYEQAGSFDSVLDEAALLASIPLKWHYRSRDESLITFSNEEIYDGNLFTFPSNRTSGRDSGVEYVYVQDGVFEGSRKGNRVEAARVADLVMSHFATYGTERSLGVIALGESQARVIEDELLKRRLARPDTERFFDTAVDEPFFVKNLENVQGDERDTIILSIGYAKGANGRLSHRFGPINMDGGERRLNVAVTRARINLKLVTSMDPSEIDANRVSNTGPRMLKDYLTYAKIGSSSEGEELRREYGYVDEDSFAGVIRDALTESGFDVEEHVGRSGCKVDLAVRHPEHKDCFCIGIVCDGDSYHAAATARDRDRLRAQVLLGMGWRLYHVWSRAWLQDPDRQKELLVEAVKASIKSFVPPVERAPMETPVEEEPIEQESQDKVQPDAEEQTTEPEPVEAEYLEMEHHTEEHRYGFQSYPDYKPPRRGVISEIELLKQFIYAQAPFSVEYFLHKYRVYCYGPGQRMTETIRRSGIGYLQTKLRDTVMIRKEHGVDYVFRRDQRGFIPRVVGSRSIADISTTELREGALLVLKGYMGELDRAGLIEETAAAFEFARRGRTIEQRISEAVDDLRVYGKVKVVDGYYVPTDR